MELPKVIIHAFLQAALVGVVKAVLSVYLLQVFPQHRFMREHHVAVVASMRLVSAVKVQMIEQRALLRKRLSTYFTLKWFNARVDPHVSVQVALLCECLATEQTHEQLVHFQVVGVVFQLSENSGALGALVVPLRGLVVPSLVRLFNGRKRRRWA